MSVIVSTHEICDIWLAEEKSRRVGIVEARCHLEAVRGNGILKMQVEICPGSTLYRLCFVICRAMPLHEDQEHLHPTNHARE